MNKPYQPKHPLLRSVLLLGMLLPALLLAQGPGKRSYLAAESLRKQNNCRDAIRQYDEAIKLEPSNYKYYFQRGKCEYKMKNFDGAKESFKYTVEFKRNFTPAYSLLAKIYKNEKDYANAIYYYEEAARYESNTNRKVQYKLLLVNLLMKEDRVRDARRHISEAKSLDPSHPNILYYNAEISASDKNWDAARKDYETALNSERLASASPAEKAKYYYGLGLALSNLGDAAGAKKAWSKANFGRYKQLIAQQMRENNHVFYYKIAVSYYLNGEYDEAERFIQKALELQSNFSSAFILKGKISYKKGNTLQAINHYQRAISMERSPEKKAKMYRLIASLQLKNNDSSSALNSITKAMEASNGKSASLLYMKAKAEYSVGRYNDAVSTLENLLQAGVDTKSKAKYSFMLGMAAKKSRDTEKARTAFKNALYGPYKPAAKVELDKLTGKS
ncbi:MAG: tetratricopeptide repeat protein [Bacteroidota bacterium]